MKKALYLLLVALLISEYGGQTTEKVCGGVANSQSDCEKLKLGEGYYRCCFVEQEGKVQGQSIDYKGCVPVTKEIYDKIDDYIDEQEDNAEAGVEIDEYSIDCGSNYLVVSLLIIILLF